MRIKMTIRVEESNSKITSSLRKIHLKLYRVAKTKFLESLYIARVSLSKSNADQTVKYHPSREGIKG